MLTRSFSLARIRVLSFGRSNVALSAIAVLTSILQEMYGSLAKGMQPHCPFPILKKFNGVIECATGQTCNIKYQLPDEAESSFRATDWDLNNYAGPCCGGAASSPCTKFYCYFAECHFGGRMGRDQAPRSAAKATLISLIAMLCLV